MESGRLRSSGVLAIAAARVLHRPVLASDIDITAVRAARENVRRNRAAQVTVIRATGVAARQFGVDQAAMPGAGAAGGAGGGAVAFLGARLVSGIDFLLDLVRFPDAVRGADLVVTGEGRIDGQTAYGKTALGVAQRARAAGVACVAVGGGVTPEGAGALAELGVPTLAVIDQPMTIEEAMSSGPNPVERAGERLARLLALFSTLTKSHD